MLVLAAALLAAQQDVVVILWDDVGAADVDLVDTPNLDAMRAEGVWFSRAYAQSWCAPTRNSIYQSTWQGRWHGNICAAPATTARLLPDTEPSLVKVLDGQGYYTALIGKWHQGMPTTFDVPWINAPQMHGFDVWRQGFVTAGQKTECMDPSWPATGSYTIWDGAIIPDSGHHTPNERGALLLSYQEALAAGQPFFAMMATQDAHSPWKKPPSSVLPPGFQFPTPFPNDRQLFESEIVALDFVLGELRAAIPNAVFLVVGDNGTPEEVDVDSLAGSKMSCLEGGIRVPMVMAGPGIPSGVVVDDPVHVVDIAPTLLHGLGITVPDWVQGQSLIPAITGSGPLQRDWIVCQEEFSSTPGPTNNEACVVEKRWKLHVREDLSEVLYDLENDPGEMCPLPATPGEAIYDRLKSRLAQVGF